MFLQRRTINCPTTFIVPPIVQRTLLSSGRSLDSNTLTIMESRFSQDFSNVRVHADRQSAESSKQINARAYTVGNHIVFGAGEYSPNTLRGTKLLAHELNHVVQQEQFSGQQKGIIQRSVGEGNEEISTYLNFLEVHRRIEDKPNSDDKARAIVNEERYLSEPLYVRILLIREMLEDYTGTDDEQAILKILENASENELECIIDDIKVDELVDDFHGDEKKRVLKLLAKHSRGRPRTVSLDWNVSYKTQGAEELRPKKEEMVIDQFNAYPLSHPEPISVVSDAKSIGTSGMQTQVASGVKHPLNVGGRGFINYHLGGKRMPGPLIGEYKPITKDHKMINAHIDVRFGVRHFSTIGTSEMISKGETRREEETLSSETEETATRSLEKSKEKAEEFAVKVNGELTASLKSDSKIFTGAEISGDTLVKLLGLGGIKGKALKALLSASGALKGTKLILELTGSLGFQLTGTLGGEVGKKWSEIEKEIERKGEVATERTGKTLTEGEEVRSGKKIGRTKSRLVLEPITEEAKVSFEVE